MRYCLNHLILVQGFCPLKIEITVLTFLVVSVSNCLKTIRELAEYFHNLLVRSAHPTIWCSRRKGKGQNRDVERALLQAESP